MSAHSMLYAPLRARSHGEDREPVVSVGAAGDYDPATGKVEGAEDPCYGAAPGLPRSLCLYYAAHPEKRMSNGRPLDDPGIHLHFSQDMIDKARAQQAAHDAAPATYTVAHYGRWIPVIPTVGGGIVGVKYGLVAGLLTFGGLFAFQAFGSVLILYALMKAHSPK